MKMSIISLLLIAAFTARAQKEGITFRIETLKPPNHLIKEIPGEEVTVGIAPEALASSIAGNNQVYLGAHPFFNGMYQAYAEHRPFELSPDMIWLLICQGFAQHINNNSEELRSLLVNFGGRKSLVVKSDAAQPLSSLAAWEKIVAQFVKKAGDDTGPELFSILTPSFSTTGPAERIAMQITALESTKAYFEYIVLYPACGIPEITLKGTPEDWKQLAAKAAQLRKYKLDWWIDEIDPLLQQFIYASEGKVSTDFWRNMFKYHTKGIYGAKIIDGWIVKFFPYNNKQQRNDLKSISNVDDLPDERVNVDFKLAMIQNDGSIRTTPLQLIAGFTSLKQDHQTMRLTPQIGWLVSPLLKNPYTAQINEAAQSEDSEMWIRVSEVPEEVTSLKTIKRITIEFLDSIRIPEQMTLSEIDRMSLTGKITNEEKARITAMFPDTDLSINYEAQKNRRYETVKKEEEQMWEELQKGK